ncbi:STAND family AAA ATPase [Metapseudomonas otitidis]|uniref:STAND family AAA ATPase n=1 Tax=Metapseudomonas otitidis TaxID=319939 RepID=UPI0013F5BA83|nr:metallophosphoesterase [Pseudomonas otitidis]
MKLGILHLSDIHFRTPNDPALKFGSTIAKSCYKVGHETEKFIIIVTGDIAFSGKKEEYDYAKKLLLEIRNALETELRQEIDIFAAPGNHDCSLLPEDETRSLVIEKVIDQQTQNLKQFWLDTCTKAQSEYFLFEKEIRKTQPIFEDNLWKEFEIKIQEETLRISSINAAWMSRINETAGQLVFPIDRYLEHLESPCNLRLALLHHPLNWYCQATYHPMRKALKTNCSAILSGHEHSIGSEVISDSSGQSTLKIEAPALQPHENDLAPQFSCLLFDTENNSVIERRFIASNSSPKENGNAINHSLNLSERCINSKKIHPDFRSSLMDPGGKFTHPQRGELNAEDIFVYPQLEESSPDVEKKSFSASELYEDWKSCPKTLILGDDESGKSFLLKRYFLNIHEKGGMPLYIKCSDLGSVTEREIEKIISNNAEQQYLNPSEFIYAERDKKIFLIDDLDQLKGGIKTQEKIINILQKQSTSIIATASSRYKISELLEGEVASTLLELETYKIKPFGHLLRNTLIKKWCQLSDIQTRVEFDSKVHSIETLINGILGRNIVPAKPIYLLIFLQGNEQRDQGELQNSSFSYYYQYIIIKSLKDSGYRTDQLDEIFSYLSQLAWHFKTKNRKELDTSELREFNKKFSEEFTSVDFDQRLQLLYKAKILAKAGNYYRFTYAYIYYLFVGKYLSDNLHEASINNLVENYCKELYLRENANTVMFLTHYTNDPRVINNIATTLDSCFEKCKPIQLNGDMSAVNSLVDSASRLLIKDLDVNRNQIQQKQLKDNLEERSEEDESAPRKNENNNNGDQVNLVEIVSEMNLTIKTSEILSNIVKNYYGSINKNRKKEYLSSIFDGSLRTLSALFSGILEQPEGLVAEIEKNLKERFPNLKSEDINSQARKFTFQFIGMVATSLIARAGQLLSSDKIKEDIRTLVTDKNNNSYRLIELASCLTQPGNIPFDTLEGLARDLGSNTFAFTILQSLVYYHLHMFHTTDRDKQRLSKIALISIQASRTIDHSTKKTKMASRSSS